MATAYETRWAPEFKPLSSTFPQPFNEGTNFNVEALMFDAASDEATAVGLDLVGYTGGNLTVSVVWYADTATSGDVVWGCSLAAITPNTDSQDVATKTFATETTATDSHLGTTAQRVHTVDVTVSNLDNVVNGDLNYLRVRRVGSSGSDTMTGDAGLIKVVVAYTV